MPHSPAGLVSDAKSDHLVVAPQSAVEKHQLAPGEVPAQPVGHRRTTGDEKEGFPSLAVDDLEPDRIALFRDSWILPDGFDIERNFGRHGIRDDRYTRMSRDPRKL